MTPLLGIELHTIDGERRNGEPPAQLPSATEASDFKLGEFS